MSHLNQPSSPAILRILAGAMRRFGDARRRAATLRDLRAVDDATLRDIGMSRAELNSISLADPSGRRRHRV